MSRTTVNLTKLSQFGTAISGVSGIDEGFYVPAVPGMVVIAENTHETDPITLTIPAQNITGYGTEHKDIIVSISAGSKKVIGNIELGVYRGSTGYVSFDVGNSLAESVTLQALYS